MKRPVFKIGDEKFALLEEAIEHEMKIIDEENIFDQSLMQPDSLVGYEHPYLTGDVLHLYLAFAKQYEYFKNKKHKKEVFLDFLTKKKFKDKYGWEVEFKKLLDRPFRKDWTDDYFKNAMKAAEYIEFAKGLHKIGILSQSMYNRIRKSRDKNNPERMINEFTGYINRLHEFMAVKSFDSLEKQMVIKRLIQLLNDEKFAKLANKMHNKITLAEIEFIGYLLPLLDKKVLHIYINTIEKRFEKGKKIAFEIVRDMMSNFSYEIFINNYYKKIFEIKNSFDDIHPHLKNKARYLIGILAPFYIVADKWDDMDSKINNYDRALIKLSLTNLIFKGNPFNHKPAYVSVTEPHSDTEKNKWLYDESEPYKTKLIWEGLFK